MAEAEFGLLGPLRITLDARRIAVPSAKERALIAVLIIDVERPVSITQLIDAIWGDDPPESARKSVHTYVWRLRRSLGVEPGNAERIAARPSGYQLRAGPEDIDVTRFGRLLDEGKRAAALGDQAATSAKLRAALALWRGDPLQDVTLHGSYQFERDRLTELRVTAIELLMDAELACGRPERAVGELQALVNQHPLRERPVGQLMRALFRLGRQSEALVAFHRLRERLADELGIDPSPALLQLYDSVLKGELRPDPGEAFSPVQRTEALPRQLPRDLSHWVGRERELSDLTGLLNDRDPAAPAALLVITGTPGVGKTAMAVHWAHSIAHRFPDGQLYLNLRGHAPAPAIQTRDALSRLLDSLGVPDRKVPSDCEAAAGLFRSVIAGKKALVLLDDAASPAQVRALLPGSPESLVIVTSRVSLRGLAAYQDVRHITLTPFRPQESLTLLSEVVTRDRVMAEPAAAVDLADLCAHIPLALRIAAANLLDRPSKSIADYATDLRNADRLSFLQIPGDEQAALRAAFGLSYVSLATDTGRTFRMLGLLPGRDATVPAVAALTGMSQREAARNLDQLAAAHLISEHFPGRYSLHDLLRIYAAELAMAKETAASRREAETRLFRWYLQTSHAADRALMPRRTRAALGPHEPEPAPVLLGDRQQALIWCKAELDNIVLTARHAVDTGQYDFCWRLADAMLGFFTLHQSWSEWEALAKIGLNAARHVGERYGEASALASLGNCYAGSGKLEQALECHIKAFDIRHEIGDKLECAALVNIGEIYSRLNQFENSIEYAKRAFKVASECDDEWGKCISLNNLGETYSKLEQYEESLHFTRQALTMFVDLDDPYGQGYALDNLGGVHIKMGQVNESLSCFHEALRIRREIGDRNGEADTLLHIGDVYLTDGQANRAREFWRDALIIFEDLASPAAEKVRSRPGMMDHSETEAGQIQHVSDRTWLN